MLGSVSVETAVWNIKIVEDEEKEEGDVSVKDVAEEDEEEEEEQAVIDEMEKENSR